MFAGHGRDSDGPVTKLLTKGSVLMRLRLILPLVIALGVAACESTPQDTGSSSGAGVDETISSGTDVTSTDVMIEEETTVAALDPSQPLPGSQEELVQNVGDRVFFEFDSAVLGAEARRTLDRQAEWLRLFPEIALVLEGHADETWHARIQPRAWRATR